MVQAQAQRGCITIPARSTPPRGGAKTPAKADPTAQRAVAAVASTAPEDSDDKLPTDSVMAAPLLAVRALPLHAMLHMARRCLQYTLDKGERLPRGFRGVCYTVHIYLPLDAPSQSRSRRGLGTRRGRATLLASIRRSNRPGRASPTARKWRMCLTLALYGPEVAILAIILILRIY